MKNRFHQHAIAKPRKGSLVEFIRRLFYEDKMEEFFVTIKFPEEFVRHEYFSLKEKASTTNTFFSAKSMARVEMI